MSTYFNNATIGPLLGFLFTVGTILFIALTAHRTERPGALEALQAEARGELPPAPNAAEPPSGPAS